MRFPMQRTRLPRQRLTSAIGPLLAVSARLEVVKTDARQLPACESLADYLRL